MAATSSMAALGMTRFDDDTCRSSAGLPATIFSSAEMGTDVINGPRWR